MPKFTAALNYGSMFILVHVARGCRRCGFSVVQCGAAAISLSDYQEAATTEIPRPRGNHSKRPMHRYCGIYGIASTPKHINAHGGGKRMRTYNHGTVCMGGRLRPGGMPWADSWHAAAYTYGGN